MKKRVARFLIMLLTLTALSLPARANAQIDVLITATPDVLSGAGNVTLNVTIRMTAATVTQITDAALYMPGGAVPLYSWSLIMANTPVNATIPNVYISEQQIGAFMPLEFRYMDAGSQKTVHTSVYVSRDVPQVVHQTNARFTREASAEAAAAGEVVVFTYWVGNTGSLPIYNVRLEDAAVGLDTTVDVMTPGETKTFYQSRVIAGPIVSAPVMTYVGESNADITSTSLEPLTVLLADSRLSLSLEADVKQIRAGDPVRLTYSIVNEGNVPYYNIQISDDTGGMIPGRDVLAPGNSYVYSRLESLVKSAKFYFEITCTDTFGNTSKLTSNAVDVEVVDVQQEAPALTRDLLDVKVDANLKRLTEPGEVSFNITVGNLGEAAILDLVISENSSGEFEKMDQFAPGDKMFTYKANITETTEFTFIVQGRIPSLGRVQAVSEPIVILFEPAGGAVAMPPPESPPSSGENAEATPDSSSTSSPAERSEESSVNLLLIALAVVVVLIIICVIAIALIMRRSRAAAYDAYDDYPEPRDDDATGAPYDEPPVITARVPGADEPVPVADDEVTLPVARRSVSTDDVLTRPREP